MIRLKALLEGKGAVTGEWLNKGVAMAKSLIALGFTKDAAAAIAGNMWVESTFDPTATNGIGAFGLLQWLGDRKKQLIKYANKKKLDPNSTKAQLNFIKYELLDSYDGEYTYESSRFKKAMAMDTVSDKAYAFAKFVERPAAAELASSAESRKLAAKNIYDILVGNKSVKTSKTPTKPKASSNTAVASKKTKQYVVKDGETLGGIANRNKTTVANILKKNPGLKADKIKVGQKIKI